MHNQLTDGRTFPLFHVIDDFKRDVLGIETDSSLPSKRMTRSLDQVIEWRDKPKIAHGDNDPEYAGDVIIECANRRQMLMEYIQPRKPRQSA